MFYRWQLNCTDMCPRKSSGSWRRPSTSRCRRRACPPARPSASLAVGAECGSAIDRETNWVSQGTLMSFEFPTLFIVVSPFFGGSFLIIFGLSVCSSICLTSLPGAGFPSPPCIGGSSTVCKEQHRKLHEVPNPYEFIGFSLLMLERTMN